MKMHSTTKKLIPCWALMFLVTAACAASKNAKKDAAPASGAATTSSNAPMSMGSGKSSPITRSLFNFEGSLEGWKIPDWAFAKADNAAVAVTASTTIASRGTSSLRTSVKFLPKMWSGSYVEIEKDPANFMDFSAFEYLLVDIYIPEDAPKKLNGEVILTVGEGWSWTEMRKAMPLNAGTWTTLWVDITPDSTDWKVRLTDDLRKDIRKLGVRVSSNYAEYTGYVYVDNIRLVARVAK
jgi:hypothetical protein